jgi:branched-chain amino acid transport system substrate-binding protein
MSSDQIRPSRVHRVSRRQVLKTLAVGGLAATSFPGIRILAAEKYPALGTYPKGVMGDSVFIGITQPLSGPYSAAGEDTLKGNKLAIELLNSGELAKVMPELSGKGVLGKKLEYGVADSETKPNPAVQAQTRFIREKNAIMMTGSFSSSTAIALQQLGQREKVIYMCGPSGSNDTTGKGCRRYGFRSQQSAYMASKALAPVLAKQLGKGLKAAYLVPDYTFGHTFFDSMTKFTSEHGWTVAEKQVFPLGEHDFSSYLLNIANSSAKVLINLGAGGDLVSSAHQAQQFGLFKKMKYVVPNIGPFMAQEIGAELMEGVYGTFDFWWTMAEHNKLAKFFVDEFEKRYKYKPRWSAHEGYQQIILWAIAVERAKTFYPVKVIKALESGRPVETEIGRVHYRAEDHQLVRPVPVVVGKAPNEMKSKDDFFHIVELVPGEKTLMPLSEGGCNLGSYT